MRPLFLEEFAIEAQQGQDKVGRGNRDELLRLRSAVRGVLPRIAERAEAAEKDLAVPEENFRELERTGVHRFLEPRDFGGFGLPLQPFLDIVLEIATACGSTAWTFMLFAVHGYSAQFLPRRILDRLYQDGAPGRLATSFIQGGEVTESGGNTYVVNGHWPYLTGVHLADWVLLNAGHGDDTVKVLLTPDEVEVVEDWQVLGLRATASHSVKVTELEVPAERVVLPAEENESHRARAEAMEVNRLPMPAVVALGTVTPILGMTFGVLSQYERLLRQWTRDEKLLPGNLERLARLHTQGASLELLQRESARILDAAVTGQELNEQQESRVRMNAAWIARSCREMVSEVQGAAGTRKVFEGNPLLRHVTGVMTLCTHFFVDYDRLSVNHGARLLERRRS